MNDFVAGLIRWLVRGVLLLAGLVLFVGLLVLSLVLALVWGLRFLWARLTGQPIAPWAMRVDPRTGWSTVVRTRTRWTATRTGADEAPGAAAPGKRMGVLPGADDVTDVQPREPGEPGEPGEPRV